VLASWASDVIDYIGAGWRFVPTDKVTLVNGATGVATEQIVECTHLPMGDPRVRAVDLQFMVRIAATTNANVHIFHGSGMDAGYAYSSGVASRGGAGTLVTLVPGGATGRQIRYTPSAAGVLTYVYSSGYWIADANEPAGEYSQLGALPEPIAPQPGDDTSAAWGAALVALAGRGWRYNAVPIATLVLQMEGTGADEFVDLSVWVPPGDQRIVAAQMRLLIVPAAATNANAFLKDFDGSQALMSYTGGVAGRYTVAGDAPVLMGPGPTGRQVRWHAPAGVTVYVYVVGYWWGESV
jgi:hypothetical protein